MGDRISRLDDYRDRLQKRVGPPEPDHPITDSEALAKLSPVARASQRLVAHIREQTGGGSLRDERNRTAMLKDPEHRSRSRDLLRSILSGEDRKG